MSAKIKQLKVVLSRWKLASASVKDADFAHIITGA